MTGRSYKFALKVNHAISRSLSVSPQWPITVPSYHGEHGECLQVFFDHTQLHIARGTIAIDIEGPSQPPSSPSLPTKFRFEANYDISESSAGQIHQMRYRDAAARQLVLTLNGAVLLSLRFDFDVRSENEKQPSRYPIPFSAYSPAVNTMINVSMPCVSESPMTVPAPIPVMLLSEMPTLPSMEPMLPCASALPLLPVAPVPFAMLSMLPSLSIGSVSDLLALPLPTQPIIKPKPRAEPPIFDPLQSLPLLDFACTTEGARFVCSELHKGEAGSSDFALWFCELLPLVPRLMMSSVGHSVCRALYTLAGAEQKQRYLRAMLPSFASIATNQHGSFALIRLFSMLTTAAEIDLIVQGFASRAVFDALIECRSGYHVLKKFLDFGFPHCDALLRGLQSDFGKYASHHYGVPIVRVILDRLSADNLLAESAHNGYLRSVQSLALHADVLVANEHGNYVIQQLLDIGPPAVTDLIKGRMRTKFAFFAKHKFASNVVEKCLTLPRPRNGRNDELDWTRIVVHELLRDARRLINHKFGNYCLQTALSACIATRREHGREPLLRDFVETVRPLLCLLRVNVRKKWQVLLFKAGGRYY